MPSDNGYIIYNTRIAVDYWRYSVYSHYFFLTHAHADHMEGLTSKWDRRIYCTVQTAKACSVLRGVKFGLFEFLDYDQRYEITSESDDCQSFFVTLFNAQHCPGSAMLLFEGNFGRILCTGDFRIDKEMTINLLNVAKMPIDRLYLDTTNWNDLSHLPPRSEAISMIIRIMKQKPVHSFLIAIPQVNIGRETMLKSIATEMKTLIKVPRRRMLVLKALKMHEHFTDSDAGNVKIEMIPFNKSISEYKRRLAENSLLSLILPTSLARSPVGNGWAKNFNENVHIVPFSDHCSRAELEAFLTQIKARQILGFPRKLSSAELEEYQWKLKHETLASHSGTIETILPVASESMISATKISVSSENVNARIHHVSLVRRKRKRSHGLKYESDSTQQPQTSAIESEGLQPLINGAFTQVREKDRRNANKATRNSYGDAILLAHCVKTEEHSVNAHESCLNVPHRDDVHDCATGQTTIASDSAKLLNIADRDHTYSELVKRSPKNLNCGFTAVNSMARITNLNDQNTAEFDRISSPQFGGLFTAQNNDSSAYSQDSLSIEDCASDIYSNSARGSASCGDDSEEDRLSNGTLTFFVPPECSDNDFSAYQKASDESVNGTGNACSGVCAATSNPLNDINKLSNALSFSIEDTSTSIEHKTRCESSVLNCNDETTNSSKRREVDNSFSDHNFSESYEDALPEPHVLTRDVGVVLQRARRFAKSVVDALPF